MSLRGIARLFRNPVLLLPYLAVAAHLIFPSSLPAADESLEYKVKAAFLLNFTKFIDWPPAAFEATDSPFAICILGDDPFGPALDQIVEGEVVNGRKVTVQKIRSAPAIHTCQVLFLARPEKEILKTLPNVADGVLTVGEGEPFVRGGGMIGFIVDNGRVRFDINQSAAEKGGLKLSSKLLSVARLVQK